MWATDMILARDSWAWLHSLQRRFATALDVGTGPVLEYPFLFAPFVDRYDLSDYVENNLHAIRRWLDRDSKAHNWNPIFSGVLRSQDQGPDQLDMRSQMLRSSIQALRTIDLRQSNPLGFQAQYDLVTSFFCTECVDVSIEGWKECKRQLLSLVAPGGAFFSAIVQNCSQYRILGSWFPTCQLNPPDLSDLLETEGFDSEVNSYDCPEFDESGFSQFMVVKAVRRTR
jgi:hypothetical protein